MALFIFGLLALDFVFYCRFHVVFGEKAAIFEQEQLFRGRAWASRIPSQTRIVRGLASRKSSASYLRPDRQVATPHLPTDSFRSA